MEVCLINAATAAEFTDSVELRTEKIRRESCEPQLGILSLAAVLECQGCTPSLVDLNRLFYKFADSVEDSRRDEFAQITANEIASRQSTVYAFGSICSAYPLTIRVAKLVKALQPESTIVLGGPQASVVSVQTLESFRFIDFVLRGEAEETLPTFLNELFGQRRFDLVAGLTHRSVFGVQYNPDASPVSDLDALPSPAYHLTGELVGLRRASLELGRGCPFSCTFCSTNDFFRRKFRLRSPERILNDMRAIEAEYGIRDFDLVHDMFTVDVKRVKAFCHALIESGEGYTWTCSARTDCVDEELIQEMAAAGCTSMFFGVETGSARMQKIIDKHLDPSRAHKVIDMVDRAGIRATISLITGFPQETWDDLQETMRMFMHSARTPGSGPNLNLLAPLANTPLHLKYKDQMTLDLLCSDMSHQGRKQNSDDMELIRKHPDVFPNFYLLPTPYLDRGLLLELREFILMATLRFRWLLGAVDQATTGILDVFVQWFGQRKSMNPSLAGSDMRQYYRTPQFRIDFIEFLRKHPAGSDAKVHALLDFEDAMSHLPQKSCLPASATKLDCGCQLDWSDIPIRAKQSRVIELSYELQDIIDAVRGCRDPNMVYGRHFYVVTQKENAVYHVSPGIARVLEACDGRRTISGVITQLSIEIPEVSERQRDYIFVSLIEKARTEGLVAIYRTASEAADSHEGRLSISEYSEMSACASEQNLSSVHRQ